MSSNMSEQNEDSVLVGALPAPFSEAMKKTPLTLERTVFFVHERWKECPIQDWVAIDIVYPIGPTALVHDFRRQMIVKLALPPCSSTLLQDILCHAAFCIPKIQAEVGHDCDKEPFRTAALRMFLRTLYDSAVDYWQRVFPSGTEETIDGQELGFRQTVVHWIRNHEIFGNDDTVISVSLDALKVHLTDHRFYTTS